MKHILGIRKKKAAQKLGLLNRISSFLDPEKKKLVSNAHEYGCALLWICLKLSINMDV